MHTTIIAEIGSAWRFGENHLQNAYRAIDLAKDCGADSVKFQWCSDPRAMEKRRNVPEGSYDILAWPEEWIIAIKNRCDEIGIEFMCTVFLPCDIEKLNPYVKRWKVASLEAQALDLLTMMRSTEKPIIASNGMDNPHWHNGQYTRLHCVLAYPAPLNEVNLSVIRNGYQGYSDHSCNELTGALAVACGAKIIEVHFMLYETPATNPEYGHSLWPETLGDYISHIRDAEVMLGDGVKKIEKCEEWALKHKVKA